MIANIDELREILRNEFLKHETEDLLEKLKQNDVPAAKCLDYEEVLAHPQYQANASIDRFEHPRMGNMVRIKPPAQFEGQRAEPGGASPAHGEHTVEILTRLGLGDAEIERLFAEKLARGAQA